MANGDDGGLSDAARRQAQSMGYDTGDSGGSDDGDGGTEPGEGTYTEGGGPSTEDRVETSEQASDSDGGSSGGGGGGGGGSSGPDRTYTSGGGPSTEDRIDASQDAADEAERQDYYDDLGAGDDPMDQPEAATGRYGRDLSGDADRETPLPNRDVGQWQRTYRGRLGGAGAPTGAHAMGPGRTGSSVPPRAPDEREGQLVREDDVLVRNDDGALEYRDDVPVGVEDPQTGEVYRAGELDDAPATLQMPWERDDRPVMGQGPAVETPSTGAEAQQQSATLGAVEEQYGAGADRAFLQLQSETETDIAPGDVQQTSGGLGLTRAAELEETEARVSREVAEEYDTIDQTDVIVTGAAAPSPGTPWHDDGREQEIGVTINPSGTPQTESEYVGGPQTTGGAQISRNQREFIGATPAQSPTSPAGEFDFDPAGGNAGQFTGKRTLAMNTTGPFSGEESGGIGARSAREVTPHALMTTGGGEALQARATREEEFADRAEEGWERLGYIGSAEEAPDELSTTIHVQGDDLQQAFGGDEIEVVDLPREQVGAMAFQSAEIVERGFVDFGAWFREEQPLKGAGPTLPFTDGTQVGDVPGIAGEVVAGSAGSAIGAAGQFPVTHAADLTGDATVETQELEEPGELLAPEQVPEGTSAGDVEDRVVGMNPGIDPEDVSVSATQSGGFDIETDLSPEDARERVAAVNPGVSADDVWFDDGAPRATTIAEDGQTPTEVQGGTLATVQDTAQAQIDLALKYPYTTAALFALPAAETVGKFRQGFREGSRGAEVIRAEEITTEAGAQGEIPQSDTFRSGSTRDAVREIEQRAADQPDVVTEAVGSDQALYHTTDVRLGDPFTRAEGATGLSDVIAGRQYQGQRALEVGEGASELPGLFTSPEMNPVGLRNTNIAGGTADYFRPRMPDVTGGTDRIAAFQGDRVAGMPERAAQQGYEIRGPTGERLEGGLGRGQAKQRASNIEGAEVAPDVQTAGYEYLTQEAQPGTAQVKPSGIRSAELEAIYPPESRFVEQTGGPNVDVQFGGRIVDVPGTEMQLTFGGERVPMDAFQRAGEQGRRGEPARAGESAGMVAEEIGARYSTFEEVSRRASRERGPASPPPPLMSSFDVTGVGGSEFVSATEPATSSPAPSVSEPSLRATEPVDVTGSPRATESEWGSTSMIDPSAPFSTQVGTTSTTMTSSTPWPEETPTPETPSTPITPSPEITVPGTPPPPPTTTFRPLWPPDDDDDPRRGPDIGFAPVEFENPIEEPFGILF